MSVHIRTDASLEISQVCLRTYKSVFMLCEMKRECRLSECACVIYFSSTPAHPMYNVFKWSKECFFCTVRRMVVLGFDAFRFRAIRYHCKGEDQRTILSSRFDNDRWVVS